MYERKQLELLLRLLSKDKPFVIGGDGRADCPVPSLGHIPLWI